MFDRRSALMAIGGSIGMAVVSPGLAGSALGDERDALESESQWIDAHVHVWTPDLEQYPLAEGFSKQDMQPPSFTPEQLFEHARPSGVARIVLIQMSYYGYDNSYMLDMMKQHQGVFSGVAVIDENDRPRERMKELKEQGVRGFRIRPGDRKPDEWLAGDGMAAMWRTGAEEGLAMCCLINPQFLPSVAEMCRRFPETPAVIDHFGRVGIDGTIRDEDLASLTSLSRHKNAFVKVSAYYALGKKSPPYTDLIPMIRRCLDAFGPERLMWASDCPFQVQGEHTYPASIELVRDRMELSQGDRDWLLRKTAQRVYFAA